MVLSEQTKQGLVQALEAAGLIEGAAVAVIKSPSDARAFVGAGVAALQERMDADAWRQPGE